MTDERVGFTLNPNAYDFFKFMALVILPALGALYAALSTIWGFPGGVQVVGSIAALETFLGVILKKASANYAAQEPVGDLVLEHDEDGGIKMRMEAYEDPFILNGDRGRAVFAIKKRF